MKMLKHSIFISAILLFQEIPLSSTFGHSLHELNRPYFCSTCFSNTQDQNYHCCFYFFKCCAEARRLGSRSTTPSPRYPGLPVPSQMTFIVQNRKEQPCVSVDCSDPMLASNLCCHMQKSQNGRNHPTSFVEESRSKVFKPAVNIQVMEFDGSDFGYNNETGEISESETSTETATTTSDATEIHHNPFSINQKSATSGRKLFIPPSLAVDHVIGDSNQKGDGLRKHGWFTKEILSPQDDDN